MTDLIDDLSHYIAAERRLDVPPPAATEVVAYSPATYDALIAAAKAFDARRDSFAEGKGAICRDLAAKLMRYGRFASDKQADFARKLISWAQSREQKTSAPAPTPRPNTWAAIQHFARVTVGDVRFAKKREEPLWWILWGEGEGTCVGKITEAGAVGFAGKIRMLGADPAAIKAALDEIERDPLAAIKAHGVATGRCGCCGRELTDPDSIALGIGPICADKLGGGF